MRLSFCFPCNADIVEIKLTGVEIGEPQYDQSDDFIIGEPRNPSVFKVFRMVSFEPSVVALQHDCRVFPIVPVKSLNWLFDIWEIGVDDQFLLFSTVSSESCRETPPLVSLLGIRKRRGLGDGDIANWRHACEEAIRLEGTHGDGLIRGGRRCDLRQRECSVCEGLGEGKSPSPYLLSFSCFSSTPTLSLSAIIMSSSFIPYVHRAARQTNVRELKPSGKIASLTFVWFPKNQYRGSPVCQIGGYEGELPSSPQCSQCAKRASRKLGKDRSHTSFT